MFHLQEFGQLVRLWWNYCQQLWLDVFLNQNYKHWFLKDMLQFVITKTHEICDELGNLVVPDNLVDLETNVFDAKLEEFTICMKHQVLNVLHLFFSFLHEFDRKKCHNILPLMLDLKFKTMHMVTNYLSHVNVSILIVQCDEHLFLVLLVHYYKVLMPKFLDEVKVHNFDFKCDFFF